jgi:hypothetical protein
MKTKEKILNYRRSSGHLSEQERNKAELFALRPRCAMKSKCCGAEARVFCEASHSGDNGFTNYYICKACENACDLAPTLRSSEEVLEFVKKSLDELNKVPVNYVRKRLIQQLQEIKQFIEGKE